jgi:hypothetical protein
VERAKEALTEYVMKELFQMDKELPPEGVQLGYKRWRSDNFRPEVIIKLKDAVALLKSVKQTVLATNLEVFYRYMAAIYNSISEVYNIGDPEKLISLSVHLWKILSQEIKNQFLETDLESFKINFEKMEKAGLRNFQGLSIDILQVIEQIRIETRRINIGF